MRSIPPLGLANGNLGLHARCRNSPNHSFSQEQFTCTGGSLGSKLLLIWSENVIVETTASRAHVPEFWKSKDLHKTLLQHPRFQWILDDFRNINNIIH